MLAFLGSTLRNFQGKGGRQEVKKSIVVLPGIRKREVLSQMFHLSNLVGGGSVIKGATPI